MVKRGPKKENPQTKRQQRLAQIKMHQKKGDKGNKGNLDTLLGDPMVNTKKGTYKAKEKRQNQNKPEVEVNLKENLRVIDRTHLKPMRQTKPMLMIALTIITTIIIILPQVKIVAADLLMVKAVIDNLEASHKEAEAKDLNITNVNFRTISFREVHTNRTVPGMAPTANPIFREVKQMTTGEAMAGVLSKSENTVMVGPITRVTMALTNISITHMINR